MKLKEVANREIDILLELFAEVIVKVKVVGFNNWVNVNYSRETGISKSFMKYKKKSLDAG